jgi:hypothetical protein
MNAYKVLETLFWIASGLPTTQPEAPFQPRTTGFFDSLVGLYGTTTIGEWVLPKASDWKHGLCIHRCRHSSNIICTMDDEIIRQVRSELARQGGLARAKALTARERY